MNLKPNKKETESNIDDDDLFVFVISHALILILSVDMNGMG